MVEIYKGPPKPKGPGKEYKDEVNLIAKELIVNMEKGVISLAVKIELSAERLFKYRSIKSFSHEKDLEAEMDAIHSYVSDILYRTRELLFKGLG